MSRLFLLLISGPWLLNCSGVSASPTEPSATATLQRVPEPPPPSLSPEVLTERIAAAIEQSRSLIVDYQDPLGEGPFHFDPDPLLPADRIDCMTWLQWILAQAYAGSSPDPEPWLRALRYYGGAVGFDTRKHYVDRWLWLEPGPMRAVDCGEHCRAELIQLDPQQLIATREAPCPLWRGDVTAVEVQFIPQDELAEVMSALEPGFYVLFGVATERYLELYGSSGPMAQVHPALLHVSAEGLTVSHASTALERVATVPIAEWMHAVRNLHRGTALYALDPSWSLSSTPLVIEEEERCPRR